MSWPLFTAKDEALTPLDAALFESLEAPAALCRADGAILAANDGWRADVGGEPRLPRSQSPLFLAFRTARREGRGEGVIILGARSVKVLVTRADVDRFLVRLVDEPLASGPAVRDKPASAPDALDIFAAASPFGAAIVEGADPFHATVVETNAALVSMAGAAARAGASLCDLLTAAAAAEASRARASGDAGPYEVALAAEGERVAHLYLAGAAPRWAVYLLDVTEQKKIQLQLAQRNKMEAIGHLAGGVAHDFNNLLTAISLRADELLLRHPLGDPAYDNLAGIRATVDRAAGVANQLLTFSRKATLRRESLDLGEVLSNLEVLLRRLLREDVAMETHMGRDLPRVRADKGQIENAVMNLVVNARDAVRGHGGGLVRLRAARVTASEAKGQGYTGPTVGDLALIEVSDDGPGIPAAILGNIFEPFFTTKPQGEGTGLGLATVYGIVKQSDGWIVASSPPGQGAVFRVFLPEHIPPLAIEAPPAPIRRRAEADDLSGAGRILFVEDESVVRSIAVRLLRERGYEVIEAADGDEALMLAEQHAGAIDLMISDVIMPGLDGPSLLKAARPFLGDAPVIFISGYAEAEFSDLLEGEAGVSFLAKPLDLKSLAERVKARLARP
jgi:two-component system cell cycle sensor histidine kinase/response regulator CckA